MTVCCIGKCLGNVENTLNGIDSCGEQGTTIVRSKEDPNHTVFFACESHVANFSTEDWHIQK